MVNKEFLAIEQGATLVLDNGKTVYKFKDQGILVMCVCVQRRFLRVYKGGFDVGAFV
jgi:hypothetical protein